MADAATALMFDRTAAIRAGTAIVGMFEFELLVIGHVYLNRLGNGICTGGDSIFAKTGRLVTGDADHLLDGLPRLHTGSPGQRHQATDCFTLG
jgi:hypothetical protein